MPSRLLPVAFALLTVTACGGDDPPVVASTFDLDPTVAACTDFNAHVNNRWLQATELRPDQSALSALIQLDEDSERHQRALLEGAAGGSDGPAWPALKRFYADGVDENTLDRLGFEPARAEWERIAALSSPDDLRRYLHGRLAAGSGEVLAALALPDMEQPQRTILYFGEESLGLPTGAHYTDPAYADLVAAYEAYLVRLLQLAGLAPEAARDQARLALALEKRLAPYQTTPVQARDPRHWYHLKTIAQAQAEMPQWDWPAMFQRLGLPPTTEFSLPGSDFIQVAGELIETLPMEQWRALLGTAWLRAGAERLGQPFRQASFEFDRLLSGQESPTERWRKVLTDVNGLMGEPLGQAYVEHHFSTDHKALAQKVVVQVREALRLRLENADWLADATRAQALLKLDSMTFALGYPDTWNDWSDLQLPAGEYFAAIQVLKQRKFVHDVLGAVGPTPSVPHWTMWPQTVNAYYDPRRNHMVFPAAILQSPLLDPEADLAVNLGGFGAVVGHEMTHAFDDSGSQYDASGRLRNWWTVEDHAAFQARAARLRDQANAIRPLPEDPELHVHGELTLGENIADLGGLTAAYDALRLHLARHPADGREIDDLTPEQRLFMSWTRSWRGIMRPEALRLKIATNPHAPDAVRANLPPSNLAAFAEAFGCAASAPMVVPAGRRAEIW